jgi:hypothetical protein
MICTTASWELKYRVTSLSTADLGGSFARSSSSVKGAFELKRNAGPSIAVLGLDCLILS